jgi:hypothetical protein
MQKLVKCAQVRTTRSLTSCCQGMCASCVLLRREDGFQKRKLTPFPNNTSGDALLPLFYQRKGVLS